MHRCYVLSITHWIPGQAHQASFGTSCHQPPAQLVDDICGVRLQPHSTDLGKMSPLCPLPWHTHLATHSLLTLQKEGSRGSGHRPQSRERRSMGLD